MHSPTTRQPSAARRWAGWILSGLVIALLLLDAGVKLVPLQPALDAMPQLGFRRSPELVRALGGLLLVSTILYANPRSSSWGAILLTGYLGGTVAVHLRLDHPLHSHVLFGVYLGVLAWAGLCLRDSEVWRLFRPGFLGSGPGVADRPESRE